MPDAASNHWNVRVHADEYADNSLCELNLRFLELLALQELQCAAPYAASADLRSCLAEMRPTQRRAAADCPYALFDLRFADDAHWNLRLQHTERWLVAEPPSAVAPQAVNFVRLALFYAWHVAHAAALTARMQLGMTESVVEGFRRAPLDRLPALTVSESANLSVKWKGETGFWDLLMRAAAGADDTALRRVQLYGLQLAAAARLQIS